MNYEDTLEYLYNSVPMFQKQGGSAYKEGLSNTKTLDEYFEHPHTKYHTIHVGGTNGKGSTSHTLAAILQAAGYKVGLYTSPHLIDFRERMRINGEPISKEFVVGFVDSHRYFFEPLAPSFFELTTAMAFHYFALNKVDIALVEVGLGGRLDCTNIIQADLSIITNISNDHNQFLGDSLAKIAYEKAGIIKENTPVVIGEDNEETRPVFEQISNERKAPIIFASDCLTIDKNKSIRTDTGWAYNTSKYGVLEGELGGLCQIKNSNTILTAIDQLIKLGYNISDHSIRKGFANIVSSTGLMGRWQKLHQQPTLICDTGHNVAGMSSIIEQIKLQDYETLHIVIGMVDDKDVSGVLELLPTDAIYYFTKANIQRALKVEQLESLALKHKLTGSTYQTVKEATEAALRNSKPTDFIFVGGSSFIVADLLLWWESK